MEFSELDSDSDERPTRSRRLNDKTRRYLRAECFRVEKNLLIFGWVLALPICCWCSVPEIYPVCLSSHLRSYGLMQARLEQKRTLLSAHDHPTPHYPHPSHCTLCCPIVDVPFLICLSQRIFATNLLPGTDFLPFPPPRIYKESVQQMFPLRHDLCRALALIEIEGLPSGSSPLLLNTAAELL